MHEVVEEQDTRGFDMPAPKASDSPMSQLPVHLNTFPVWSMATQNAALTHETDEIDCTGLADPTDLDVPPQPSGGVVSAP